MKKLFQLGFVGFLFACNPAQEKAGKYLPIPEDSTKTDSLNDVTFLDSVLIPFDYTPIVTLEQNIDGIIGKEKLYIYNTGIQTPLGKKRVLRILTFKNNAWVETTQSGECLYPNLDTSLAIPSVLITNSQMQITQFVKDSLQKEVKQFYTLDKNTWYLNKLEVKCEQKENWQLNVNFYAGLAVLQKYKNNKVIKTETITVDKSKIAIEDFTVGNTLFNFNKSKKQVGF